MDLYQVQTESGFVGEDIIGYNSALDYAQWLATEYQTTAVILDPNDGSILKTVPYIR